MQVEKIPAKVHPVQGVINGRLPRLNACQIRSSKDAKEHPELINEINSSLSSTYQHVYHVVSYQLALITDSLSASTRISAALVELDVGCKCALQCRKQSAFPIYF